MPLEQRVGEPARAANVRAGFFSRSAVRDPRRARSAALVRGGRMLRTDSVESSRSTGEAHGLAKILIVDDESSMRFLLRMTFELAGHEVVEAADGRAAIELVEGGQVPDLVATDFMMPRMNGGELIARLRRNPATAPIPIILVSSSPGSERRTEADAFFRKPFDPDVLTRRVTQLLDRSV